MEENPNHPRQSDDYQTCLQVTRQLIARYKWGLLSLSELTQSVFESTGHPTRAKKIEQSAKHHYAIALHKACMQNEDPLRKEQAYQELARYLFRLAYNRWPGLDASLLEDVVQRAILLVYEQIDRCEKPSAIFTFASYKLLHAFQTEERRYSDETLPHKAEAKPSSSITADILDKEALKTVLTALNQLPNQRQRQVIFLKFFAGLSDKEIAQRLDISPGNVRVLRNRGLARLRQNEDLRAYFDDDSGEEE